MDLKWQYRLPIFKKKQSISTLRKQAIAVIMGGES